MGEHTEQRPLSEPGLERIYALLRALDPTVLEAVREVDLALVREVLDMTPIERLRALESVARLRGRPSVRDRGRPGGA